MKNKILQEKIEHSLHLISCWHEAFGGDIYVAFSGGIDSLVLLHLTRLILPNTVGVFADTGLEYPEIRSFVKTIDNIVWVKPTMLFTDVIEKYGYPVISKLVAVKVERLKNASEKNKKTTNLYLTGYTSTGKHSPTWKLAEKWKFLIDAPFKISGKCCDVIKKGPMLKFQKKHGLVPMIGMLGSESLSRRLKQHKLSCYNEYDTKNPKSNPLLNWNTSDVWEYIKLKNIPYSKIYDKGVTSTGCMYCMFGITHEKEPNRFQLMEKTHPKHWNYCINKLGCGRVLDYIGVPYTEKQRTLF